MKAYLEIVELSNDVVTASGGCVGRENCNDCFDPGVFVEQCYLDESEG